MQRSSRRHFLKLASAGAGAALCPNAFAAAAQISGERPRQDTGLVVLNPRQRVPLSFIIDDSTCLVNLAHFAMPRFSEAWPNRDDYKKPWWTWPREIPDSFVRKFGEWCAERNIRGKYSIVPQPACVGWVDRELPGWSYRQLDASLNLVRDLMLPNWDIHPEMATHTRVIDTKTGRPYPERGPDWMENWRWTDGKSVDELADYLSYSLRILKNAGLPCEGVTTPGGFAGRVVPELAQATLQSVTDVFQAEIPHYFKFLYTDDRSVAPRVEYASGLTGGHPQCVVSVIGCTGDWFGGWDGTSPGSPDLFISADLQRGRMVDVILREEPAIMVCHWPGIYYNGSEHGFNVFKTVVDRLHRRFSNLHWMKLSEIARYWAARELTTVIRLEDGFQFDAPFRCPDFTVSLESAGAAKLSFEQAASTLDLQPLNNRQDLKAGTFRQDGDQMIACLDLPKGQSVLRYSE